MNRWFRILTGDVLDGLRSLPDGSVRCCVTSPPYWGLRDYGTAEWEGGDPECDHKKPANGSDPTAGSTLGGGKKTTGHSQESWGDKCRKCGATRIDHQIGLEPTPEAYVAKLVEVFREVRRVLAEDGTCWLNLGSSYFGGGRGGGGSFANERAGWSVFGGTNASQSRHDRRALSCGSDDTEPQGSTGAGSACSDLCDECLADFLSHRDRISGSGQPLERSAPQPSPTGRDTEPSGFASASPGALPLDALASNTLESWRQRRGACSRCDSRASSLSASRSSSGDALAFSRMTWLDYTTRLKHKDLVPIPWMVAMALQSDGWWLRQDLIWSKPNPMPESVTDRCTKAHEYVFLLSKKSSYYFDSDAIAEPCVKGSAGSTFTNGKTGANGLGRVSAAERVEKDTRNRRSVWHIATQPFPGAHFAVMPEALVEPCVLAGSAVGDTVLDPFAGSGTVGVVALRHGRNFIGCDLNPTYADLARERIRGDAPLLNEEAA